MERTPRHILATFPIFISHRLRVTQAVFELTRSCLEADTRQAPFAKIQEVHHRRRYERCHVAYLSRVTALRKPQTGRVSLDAEHLEGEPPKLLSFDNPEVYGGISVFSTYLLKVYTSCIVKEEQDMKRKCAMVAARVLTGDNFFKILNSTFTFGGSRSLEAAYSLVNEHSEIISVRIEKSKTLVEIDCVLIDVEKRIVALGHLKDNITPFYTENPVTQKPFLCSVFDGLVLNSGADAALPAFYRRTVSSTSEKTLKASTSACGS